MELPGRHKGVPRKAEVADSVRAPAHPQALCLHTALYSISLFLVQLKTVSCFILN